MEEVIEKYEAMLFARDAYHIAKESVPSYTGHLNPCDYYQDEEREYHQKFAEFITACKELKEGE